MAEPSPKRLKSGLPLCPIHRQGRALIKLAKQNFPAVVEEGLCGATSALLEVSYVFQMLVRPPRTAMAQLLAAVLHGRAPLGRQQQQAGEGAAAAVFHPICLCTDSSDDHPPSVPLPT